MELVKGFKVSFDPWHYTSFEEELPEESLSIEDSHVETQLWEPIDPQVDTFRKEILFVDGVRRTEALVFLQGDTGEVFQGAFVSVGAGALLIGTDRQNFLSESLIDYEIKRYFVVRSPAGVISERFIPVQIGNFSMNFEVISTDREITVEVNRLMSQLEAKVVRRTYTKIKPSIVITDGPIHFTTKLRALPFVGYVKRQERLYIPFEYREILWKMKVGTRTPLVKVHSQPTFEGESTRKFDKYSWYVKISDHMGINGVARLEVSANISVEKVKSIADLSAKLVPRFASTEFTERRAPQNLLPVKALEDLLRKHLGPQSLIRRSIQSLFGRPTE